MAISNKDIFKEFRARTAEQIKSTSIFLGGLAVLYSAEVTSEVMDKAGDILIATPTAVAGAVIAIEGLSQMFNNGLRSDFRNRIKDRG